MFGFSEKQDVWSDRQIAIKQGFNDVSDLRYRKQALHFHLNDVWEILHTHSAVGSNLFFDSESSGLITRFFSRTKFMKSTAFEGEKPIFRHKFYAFLQCDRMCLSHSSRHVVCLRILWVCFEYGFFCLFLMISKLNKRYLPVIWNGTK